MKKISKLLLINIVLFIVSIGIMGCSFKTNEVDTYYVNGKQKKLNSNDKLVVNYWNRKYQRLNNKNINGEITLYSGIRIGSSKTDVVKKFNLNSKNTQYNCEIYDEANDGTTNIIYGKFSNDIFDLNYLDCALIFGYKNGEMLSYDEIDELKKDSRNPSGVIVYTIDINGLSGEVVGKDNVIEFEIESY